MDGKYGLTKALDVLTGSRAASKGHALPQAAKQLKDTEGKPLFGAGWHMSKSWWSWLGNTLLTEGLLGHQQVESTSPNMSFSYQAVFVTDEGRQLLEDPGAQLMLAIPAVKPQGPVSASAPSDTDDTAASASLPRAAPRAVQKPALPAAVFGPSRYSDAYPPTWTADERVTPHALSLLHKPTPSAYATMKAYQAGMTPDEIATQRGIQAGTVLGHLADCAAWGLLHDLDTLVEDAQVTQPMAGKVAEALQAAEGPPRIGDLHRDLQGEVPGIEYYQIKIISALIVQRALWFYTEEAEAGGEGGGP